MVSANPTKKRLEWLSTALSSGGAAAKLCDRVSGAVKEGSVCSDALVGCNYAGVVWGMHGAGVWVGVCVQGKHMRDYLPSS